MSVPLIDVNSDANLYVGRNSSQRVTPTLDLSVGGNYVPTPLRNFMQLRGPASTPRFVSQPTGQPSFHSPRSHITMGISNSQFSASTSKPTGPLSFHSPIDVGALTAESMSGGTCSLSRMTKRSLLKSTRQSEVQNLVSGYTEPYIMQLEHPIEEMTVVDPNDNGGDNFKPDEIDLTLKL